MRVITISFGIAVVEALSVGIPVFVNDWPVMQEITENGSRAILYKTKDVQDLLARFLFFMENRAACRRQSASNAVFIRHTYFIQHHIQMLKGHYKTLLPNA